MEKKSELDVKVGAEIRRIRQEQKRSQESFAYDCGVNRAYMGVLERGEKAMSIDMAKRIILCLGLSLGEFFTGMGE